MKHLLKTYWCYVRLTGRERALFNKMRSLKINNFWSYGIKTVLKNPSPKKFRLLISELQDEGQDNAEIMQSILGAEIFHLLYTIKPPELC